MSYIDKLRYLRKSKNYSQKQMAELLETTQQQYSKYEKAQQELPVRHVVTICEHFDISSDWLLEIRKDVKDSLEIADKLTARLNADAACARGKDVISDKVVKVNVIKK